MNPAAGAQRRPAESEFFKFRPTLNRYEVDAIAAGRATTGARRMPAP